MCMPIELILRIAIAHYPTANGTKFFSKVYYSSIKYTRRGGDYKLTQQRIILIFVLCY